MSILDNDLYTFTMAQAVLHNFPATNVKYRFINRNAINYLEYHGFIDELESFLDRLESYSCSEEELNFLSQLPFLSDDFIQFMKLYRFDRKYVKYSEEGEFSLEIEGPWLHTIFFEIPLLSFLSQFHTNQQPYCNPKETIKILERKFKFLRNTNLKFADFGTRRRASFYRHSMILEYMLENIPQHFVGTSNVLLAKEFNIKPIGTMAHQWIQAGQNLGVNIANSQKFMLETWVKEFRGQLGIALTDTITMDAFLNDFDLYYAKLFDGCRHDSGDPHTWAAKLVNHYKQLNIDPLTKTAVFSDNLTFGKMLQLWNCWKDKINVSFGIGTNLTNDIGIIPPNNVIKLVECQGKAVAKISDSPGKEICDDDDFLSYVKKVYNVPKERK